MILVNGRLSERSFKRWRLLPGTIAALLRCFDLCLAQSATYAGRFRDLGAPRIGTTGNLKLDVPEPPADPDEPHGIAGRDRRHAPSSRQRPRMPARRRR